MSDEPEQMIFPPAEMRDKALQLLYLVICRLVDIGKSITTYRLHFERDKLKHGVDRLARSSFAFAFHMDSQKEDEKRGKAIACTGKEASTDMVHYKNIDAPGHLYFIRFQIDDIPKPCDAAVRRPHADKPHHHRMDCVRNAMLLKWQFICCSSILVSLVGVASVSVTPSPHFSSNCGFLSIPQCVDQFPVAR